MNTCIICKGKTKRFSSIYCSNKCQATDRYMKYIERWKLGLSNGSRGIRAKNISAHLRRYLYEKSGEQCSVCGWNKKNPVTLKVPLEIDHINGNSQDNREENLRLLCPNCHALSPNFRNLNKGKGRKWRTALYIKKQSHLRQVLP